MGTAYNPNLPVRHWGDAGKSSLHHAVPQVHVYKDIRDLETKHHSIHTISSTQQLLNTVKVNFQ